MTALLAATLLLSACSGSSDDGGDGGAAAEPGTAACPESVEEPGAPAVPATPLRVEGTTQLVPQQPPVRALDCEYRTGARGGAPAPLRGERVLTGDLAPLAADLSLLPIRPDGLEQVCTLIGNGPGTPGFLVGLEYEAGARIWVSTARDANRCTDTTNGSFRSTTYIGDQVEAAYAAGRWVPEPPRERGDAGPQAPPCGVTRPGRAGQELAMVPPDGIRLVRICHAMPERGAPDVTETVELTTGYDELVTALDALPRRIASHSCASLGPADETWHVAVEYTSGPPVLVSLTPWCDPMVSNGHLESKDAGPVIPVLQRLSAR